MLGWLCVFSCFGGGGCVFSYLGGGRGAWLQGVTGRYAACCPDWEGVQLQQGCLAAQHPLQQPVICHVVPCHANCAQLSQSLSVVGPLSTVGDRSPVAEPNTILPLWGLNFEGWLGIRVWQWGQAGGFMACLA